MSLPSVFPIYPESLNGPYNVSLALPGPISEISKSIGITSSSLLLIPNAEFIQKVVEGDLGIADSILKGMMMENFLSPSLATNEEAFKKFAQLNKIELDSDINKYKKDGKLVMPKEKIKVPKEWDQIGLKSIEKTTLQSIFETQKPYIEIAKLVIENIAKIEDIVARVMPLISTSPLTCKSKKPNSNGGKEKFPKALGFNNGSLLVDELSKIETILATKNETKKKLDKNVVDNFFNPDATGAKATEAQKILLSKWTILIASLQAGDISMKLFSDIISKNGGVESKYKPEIQTILTNTSQKFSSINIYSLNQKISNVTVTFDDARDIIKPAVSKWTYKNNLDLPNIEFIRVYEDLILQFFKEKVANSMIPDEPTFDKGESSVPLDSEGKWEIVSSIYSTGEFDPNVEYQYTYKDLPSDKPKQDQKKSELNLGEEKDPYHKYKPKKLIFGIYNSKGQALNPTQPVNTIGLSGTNVIDVPTPFKKADWILSSPKWYLPTGVYQWPDYDDPTFVWEKGLQKRESKTNPNPDSNPPWKIKKYEEGEKDLITKGDAVPGNPVIVRFDSPDEGEYRNIFTDFVKFGFHKTDITKSEKDKYTSEIIGKLDIQGHIQNIYNYGQLKSSFYKRIGGEDPVPQLLKKSYRPYQIFSTKASVDKQIRDFSIANGKQPGFIWIEPEADYDLKIIRIDPTTNINYIQAQGEPEVSTEISNFVKNKFKISFSNGIPFTIEVLKNGSIPEVFQNITEYVLENWNYSNATALNENSYSYTVWSKVAPQEYVNETNLIKKDVNTVNLFYELSKEGDSFYYRKFKFKVDLTDVIINAFIGYLSPTLLISLWISYIANPNATYTFAVSEISYTLELKKIFPYKEYEYFPAGDITLFTESGLGDSLGDQSMTKPVQIDSTGKILKWYYIKNRQFTGPDDKKLGTQTIDANETKYLPTFGVERIFTIDYNYKTTKDDKQHRIRFLDSDFTLYKIKVKNENPFGSVIDPTKITNNKLKTPLVFSTGKYGHGSPDDQQEIEILKRFKLTDLDTESYYIVEGILRNPPPGDPLDDVPQTATSAGDNSYYRLPDALGAVKVFLTVLVDIFSKLIPQITKLIELFKNPPKFVTDIISEKLGQNVLFLNKDSMNTYSDGFKKVKELKKIPNKSLPAEQIELDDKGSYKTGPFPNGEKAKSIKELKKLFRESNLSNYVFVDDEGKITSILDGTATIPFGIFGINLPFGMKLDTNKITEGKPPISLIFEKDFKLKNTKNLQDSLNLKKFDDKQPNTRDFIAATDTGFSPNLSKEVLIKFQDGSQRSLPENSLDEFFLDNRTKYNFIYLEEDIEQSVLESDKLKESGSVEDLQKALDKLDKASKSKPNDEFLKSKIEEVKGLLDKLKASEQPILKFILGIVTLPIKIIGGIIEWLINFFKSLTNPVTLPQKMIELLSFQWIMQFFTPKGLLETAGIRFKPEKKIEWATQVMIPGTGTGKLPKSLKLPEDIKTKGYNKKKIKSDNFLSGDDQKIIDLSLFLNVIFNVKLPTYSALQYRQNLKLAGPVLSGFLCLIEKIINGIIDFVWSTLGIEAIIPPPHIKLCDKDDKSKPGSSGEKPTTIDKSENDSIISNGVGNADLSGFYYEVKLESGEVIQFLNREELDKYIADNIELNFDFNF